MANNNIQLSGAALQIVDTTASVTRVNSTIATLIAQTNASTYEAYLLLTAAPLNVGLPATTCWNLYVRNTSGSATINVTLTPSGGSAWVSPLVLPPSFVLLSLGSYAANPAAGGFTALTLSASANAYVELMVA